MLLHILRAHNRATRVRACNSNRSPQSCQDKMIELHVLKIEHWSHAHLATLTFYAPALRSACYYFQYQPCCFDFYVVTRSYSSRPFLCALALVPISQHLYCIPFLHTINVFVSIMFLFDIFIRQIIIIYNIEKGSTWRVCWPPMKCMNFIILQVQQTPGVAPIVSLTQPLQLHAGTSNSQKG